MSWSVILLDLTFFWNSVASLVKMLSKMGAPNRSPMSQVFMASICLPTPLRQRALNKLAYEYVSLQITFTSLQWPVLHFSQQISITDWQFDRQLSRLPQKNSCIPWVRRKSTGSPPNLDNWHRLWASFKSLASWTDGRSTWSTDTALLVPAGKSDMLA